MVMISTRASISLFVAGGIIAAAVGIATDPRARADFNKKAGGFIKAIYDYGRIAGPAYESIRGRKEADQPRPEAP